MISDLTNLAQGTLTSGKYVEKAKDIFVALGEEYSSVLATKFVDGLADDSTKLLIDSQFDKAYHFPEVIKAYAKCTRSLRRKEMAFQRPARRKETTKSETELIMETMKQNAQMVYQVGEKC